LLEVVYLPTHHAVTQARIVNRTVDVLLVFGVRELNSVCVNLNRVPTWYWKYWIVKSVFKTLKKYWIRPKCT